MIPLLTQLYYMTIFTISQQSSVLLSHADKYGVLMKSIISKIYKFNKTK